VAETPHHLAGDAAKPPPRLAPVDGIDYSQYCVVRISEYDDMCAEIERLRKALHEARMQTSLWRALCEEVQAELHDTVERSYRIEDERG
jgi:hypothetical protein